MSQQLKATFGMEFKLGPFTSCIVGRFVFSVTGRPSFRLNVKTRSSVLCITLMSEKSSQREKVSIWECSGFISCFLYCRWCGPVWPIELPLQWFVAKHETSEMSVGTSVRSHVVLSWKYRLGISYCLKWRKSSVSGGGVCIDANFAPLSHEEQRPLHH